MFQDDDILRACSKDEAAYLELRALYTSLAQKLEADKAERAEAARERRQLEDLLLSQNGYMLAVQQIALDLLNRRDVAELLQVIVESAAAILDAPYSEIMLREGDWLAVHAFTPNQPMLAGDRVTRSEAHLAWQAVDTQYPAVLDNYSTWAQRRPIYDAQGLHAVADFPITINGECVGVLAIGRSQPGYPFSDEQVQKGVWFAQLTALALDIALNYDDAKRQIHHHREAESAAHQFQSDLKTLHEVNLELSSLETTR